jgi:hypothetical protein
MPAIDSLGEASKTGTPAVIDARPVIADLRALAKAVRPVGVTLRDVLESFRDTGGIERLMDYIFYQVAAINGFDSVGHYLRAGLLVNQCVTYAVTPVAGCSARFPTGASASSGQRETSAIEAAGDDPVLRATAIALAKALGQEVEKAREQQAKAKGKSKGDRGSSERKPRRQTPERGGDTPKPDEEIPEAIPTVDPAAPTPAPSAAPAAPTPAPAAPAATAPPATPTPTPTPSDPADALLDYLFGGDG